jgi:hypothetical protein
MSAFPDRYHDAYHVGATVDLINCIHCQDEFMMGQQEQDREDMAANLALAFPDTIEEMEN